MNILIANNTKIPALKYGGTERIIWWLGKELNKLGHKITFLVSKGSYCPFADVLILNSQLPLEKQIPDNIDVAHIFFPISAPLKKPYIVTIQGNGKPLEEFDINTVFISKNHALRHNSEVFVYNGLDPDEYGKVDFSIKREHLLFLAKASRKEKNLDDCKYIARTLNEKLVVLGGYGFSFLSKVKYKGIIGGEKKNRELQKSKALLFPVRWNEPFGIAIIEALYFGAPVFGTKYGSLPELVSNEVGFLSNSKSELIEAVKNLERYDRKKCNEYVCDNFSAKKMTEKYLFYYDMVLSGKQLNSVKPVNRETNSQELLPMYD